MRSWSVVLAAAFALASVSAQAADLAVTPKPHMHKTVKKKFHAGACHEVGGQVCCPDRDSGGFKCHSIIR
jgi:Spy/CpxP family protein refolding chaperone